MQFLIPVSITASDTKVLIYLLRTWVWKMKYLSKSTIKIRRLCNTQLLQYRNTFGYGSTNEKRRYRVKNDPWGIITFGSIYSHGNQETIGKFMTRSISLQWRHNGRDSVSNHQPHACLLNRSFRRRSKKTSKLRVTGLCAGNSPGTGEFLAQLASNAENVSTWWRHHV